MKTVGQILKTGRLQKKLTFKKLSILTKIPVSTLKALEKNQFHLLPPPTYIKGFIKNISTVLGLNPQSTLAVFRRDYQQQKKSQLTPKGLVKPLNRSSFASLFQLTPLSLVGFLTFVLIVYLIFSLVSLNQPPDLEIIKPQEGQEISPPVLVKGKTDHDASLSLNGKTINLESDGSFTTVYQGQSGAHTLVFKATSRRNKTITINRHIIIK